MRKLKAGESFDIVSRLEEIKSMSAKELLEKYRLVIYSQEDIDNINYARRLIHKTLKKNTNKIKEAQNG
jgi:hypothetical protein